MKTRLVKLDVMRQVVSRTSGAFLLQELLNNIIDKKVNY